MNHTTRYAALALAGAFVFAACGGGGNSDTAAPAAQASTTMAATAAPAATPTTAATAAAAVTTTAAPAPASAKADANTASRADLTAAIQAAGVSNAARWALEVEEYRPYPANDPTMAKLRQNLAKYNPGPGVVDGIVSALSL